LTCRIRSPATAARAPHGDNHAAVNRRAAPPDPAGINQSSFGIVIAEQQRAEIRPGPLRIVQPTTTNSSRCRHLTLSQRPRLPARLEAMPSKARNASYPGWAAAGDLVITAGEQTDFQTIEDDLVDLCRRFRVETVA
jgi:hypothetical protein